MELFGPKRVLFLIAVLTCWISCLHGAANESTQNSNSTGNSSEVQIITISTIEVLNTSLHPSNTSALPTVVNVSGSTNSSPATNSSENTTTTAGIGATETSTFFSTSATTTETTATTIITSTSTSHAPTTESLTKPATTTYTTSTTATTTTTTKGDTTTTAHLSDTTTPQTTADSHTTPSTLAPHVKADTDVTTGRTEAVTETVVTNGPSPTPTSSAETTTPEIDYCLGVTCQNNGSCTIRDDNYTCNCTPGWGGRHCEQEIDYCLGVTCQNNGTCRIRGDDYTCNCTPGWGGRHCEQAIDYCQPNPCSNGGSCAQNLSVEPLYYVCTCSQGWTGVSCSDDVAECQNKSICGNGICSERLGTYKCFCHEGWNGSTCNEDIDECKRTPSLCASKINSYCNNTDGGYECICNSGFIEIGQKCQKQVLWPGYKEVERLLPEKNAFYGFRTAIPVPYFQSLSSVIYAQGNGYVTVGDELTELTPLANAPVQTAWPFSPNRIGVYWADIEFPNNNQSFMYILSDTSVLDSVENKSSLIKYVEDTIKDTNFKPLYAFMVTWENAMPRPAKDYPYDKATFQLIIATDSDISYAITSYQTVWANTNVSNRPHFSAVYSSENGTRAEFKKPSNGTGPDFWKLWTKSQGRNNYDCIQSTQTANNDLGANIQSLTPCPCFQAQVSRDKRFEIVPNSSSPTCYKSYEHVEVHQGTLSQKCCYNQYGLLINNSKKADIPIYTIIYLKSAYDVCCAEGSRLCGWFYEQINLPSCLNYTPPFIGAGFGDPHIVTFDGNRFSFNLVGDFVIFRSGNEEVELQGRTKLSDNGKTTYFEAYAVKAESTTQFYLQNNAMISTATTEPNNTVRTANYTVEIRFTNGALSYMIYSNINKDPNSVGLLGSFDGNAANDFKFSNGTLVEGTADHLTGEIINEFVESWRVNGSDSQIKNNLTQSQNNASYNQSEIPALPTSADAVRRLLTGSDVDEAKKLCGDHLFCLQDFYINHDNTSALSVLDYENEISMLTDFTSQIPVFANRESTYIIDAKMPRILKLETVDNKTTNFTIDSDFSDLSGFKLDNGTFTWDVNASLEELRNRKYPGKAVFYATFNGVSTAYAPVINLCLCNKTTQCAFFILDGREEENYFNNDVSERDNVNSVICDCGGRAAGEFCEQEVNYCENCYNKSGCEASNTENCPPCPDGYDGDGMLCRDKDECAINSGGCQQVCTNFKGGYNCSCLPHFETDGEKCKDIDECENPWNYCGTSLKYCSNKQGSASCSCYPGFVGNQNCIRAPYVFAGTVKLAIYGDQKMDYNLLVKDSEEFKYLAQKVTRTITDALHNSSLGTDSDLYVETLSFENDSDEGKDYLIADFAIYTSRSSLTADNITEALEQSADKTCTTFCKYGDLLVYTALPQVNSDGSTPCDKPLINYCDPSTTTCKYEHQKLSCECRKGYIMSRGSLSSCTDIDECTQNETICGPEKGDCHNTAGSYKCDCRKGQFWDESTLQCVADQCSSNPCENDGICHVSNNNDDFVCSCTYGWNGPLCADEDTDARRMKIAVICVSAILGFCCLALFVISLVLCIKQRRKVGKSSSSGSYYSEIKPLPRHKDSQRSSTEMEENGQSNLYNRLNNEQSGNKYTSFQAPAFGKKEGNSTVYPNSAFEEEIVARL